MDWKNDRSIVMLGSLETSGVDREDGILLEVSWRPTRVQTKQGQGEGTDRE